MSKAKTRKEIDEKYKWDIEDIYVNENLWEEDFNQVKELAQQIQSYKNTLKNSAEQLLEVLRLSDEIDRKTSKLFLYAKMRRDEDNTNDKYKTLFDRAEGLTVLAKSASAFIVPEILSISDEQLQKFLNDNDDLKIYSHFIDTITRQKEHILSPEEEKLMAMVAEIATSSSNIFTMLNNADIKFPVIKDEEGNDVELTKGNFGRFMESSDRRVRKDAFKALYSSYNKLFNTLGTTLSSSVKTNIFYSKARKYNSALEASLDQDNVTVDVYENLIKTVHNNLHHLHRYMNLRKKVLEVDELHIYDLYTPLVKEYKVKIPYEKAKEIVLAGLQPLGDDYLNILKQGLDSGWIDVYENVGKTSGAYSWGSYDTHPYILLNYDDKLNDVFTLAHELGHSLHSYYSNRNQPFVNSQYTIFVAEVASTVNELLLSDYMLKNSTDIKEKMNLINHYLEQFRGTVFRQTMFAEFEKLMHERAEKGEAITSELLSNIYNELNKFYFGPDVVIDDEVRIEWSRIPHFYSAFYVYKYATGFSAASAIKQKIIEGEPNILRDYINFLKAGGSDYPLNLLKNTGVDLTTPEPIELALEQFGNLVEELDEMFIKVDSAAKSNYKQA
ncbi:Oligoendopeptidase F [Candidatus Syntrophocurvum alkaliphilum]|uniref:Oligopeptidase F n=1 Tax=Candidatus Syntrophocurvum alkaliphilum TaxID=2293317 RepID=A0A6I6DKS5_9FIRM|nr:oligoendopeptidase F [Candidatus Syntrophocurvum alkaliphilum]QGU00125.1 Oligoendopeptidase F [Candidatus Syntrophocurvum alkaliphilum]